MNPYEKLVRANHDYHEACDEVFRHEFELGIDQAANVKAIFGGLNETIYRLMLEAQKAIKPYFGTS